MNGVAYLLFLPVAESWVAIFFFAGIIKHRFYGAEILRVFSCLFAFTQNPSGLNGPQTIRYFPPGNEGECL
jgi:hypothetical protein